MTNEDRKKGEDRPEVFKHLPEWRWKLHKILEGGRDREEGGSGDVPRTEASSSF